MYSRDINNDELSDDIVLKANHNIRFTDFPLHTLLVNALFKNGFIFPSPVQYHILSQGVIEENLIVQAKSGTGKTIAFVILILNRVLDILHNGYKQPNPHFELLSLLIAPTREICIQINKTISMFIDYLKDIYSIDNICCIGGNPISEDIEKFCYNTPTIMTSTPGRFIQLMNYRPNNFLSINALRNSLIFLVFDEADRLLEDCFIEQSKYLLELCLDSSTAQLVAFSATFPLDKLNQLKEILYRININTKDEKSFKLRLIQLCSSFGTNNTNSNQLDVLNYVQDVRSSNCSNQTTKISISNTLESPVLKNLNFFLYDINLKEILQFNMFNENNYNQWAYVINSVIDILIRVPFRQSFIFTNNGSVGYKIMSALRSLNIQVLYTSGRRPQNEREEIITSLQENKCRVVVCSDLLARGIDIKMVDIVINVDIPIDKETFLHRAGRSGRFGQKGVVICIPTHKQDYDSFLYFFNQLGITFLSFSEHYSQNGKNCVPYQVDNVNFEIEKDTTITQLLPDLLYESASTNLKGSEYKHSNEYDESIDFSSLSIDKVPFYHKLTDLQADNIDKNILNIWKDLMGTTA